MTINFAKAQYSEVIDISTSQNAPTIFAFHTPTGVTPYKMLAPFFNMFQRYKYLGASVTLVPASRLPLDPQAYAIEGGTNNADPRDIWNPVLFKGVTGESISDLLNGIFNDLQTDASGDYKTDSVWMAKVNEQLTNFYYTCLTDTAWKKGNVQSTIKLPFLHPMVRNVATTHTFNQSPYIINDNDIGSPEYPIGNSMNNRDGTPYQKNTNYAAPGWAVESHPYTDLSQIGKDTVTNPYDNLALPRLFSGKPVPLPVLPTMQGFYDKDRIGPDIKDVFQLPKVYEAVMILPPSIRSYSYFRVVINHHFEFFQYRPVSLDGSYLLANDLYGTDKQGTDVKQTVLGIPYASSMNGLTDPTSVTAAANRVKEIELNQDVVPDDM